MNTSKNQKFISKVVALIIVSLVVSWLLARHDVSQLVKLNASPSDYLDHKRHVLQSPFAALFIMMLIQGGIFIGAIEFISYVVGLYLPKKPDA